MAQQEIVVKIPLNAGVNLASSSVPEAIQPGELLVSNNTRLAQNLYKGTVVRAPAESLLAAAPSDYSGVHGALPSGTGESTLLCYRPLAGNKVAGEDAVGDNYNTTDSVALPTQADHVMTEILRSGQPMAGYMHSPPSIATNSDGTWYASIVANGRNLDLFVSVETPGGSPLVARKYVRTIVAGYSASDIGINGQWCALTYAGGVMYVWYKLGAAQPSYAYRSLTVSGRTLTVGAETLVAAGATHINTFKADVCTDGQYAYLITANLAASLNTTALLRKIDPVTNATSTLPLLLFTAALALAHTFAIHYVDSTQLVVVCGTATSTGRVVSVNPVAFTLTWTYATGFAPPSFALVTIASLQRGSTRRIMAAFSSVTGTGVGAAVFPNTIVCWIDAPTGTFQDSDQYNWMVLAGPAADWSISSTERYPVLPLMRALGSPNPAPGVDTTVEDPAVSLLLLGGDAVGDKSVIARYGVDRLYQAFPSLVTHQWSSTCVVSEGKLYAGYLTDRNIGELYFANATPGVPMGQIAFETGFPSLRVVIDMEGGPRRFAHDSSGVALSGTAQPVRWDGRELAEHGWLHKPRIYVDPIGGSSSATWSGEYVFRVQYVARDASGAIVRSAPSLPVIITPVATKPRLWVQQAWTARDGLGIARFGVEVYVATITDNAGNPGDGLYYLQNPALSSASTDGCYTYTAMELPVQGSAQIFSDGIGNSELLPVPAPPSKDATFIASRMWTLDAEVTGRIWPSKVKQPGIAVEFASELTIDLDGASGALTGLCEFDGEPLVFAERGIFRVSGEGPNNNLSQGGFAAPRLVSATGCIDKMSIVRFPFGVMFASIEGTFCAITGEGFKRYDAIFTPGLVTGAVVRTDSSEIVYSIAGFNSVLVYNWEVDKWTTWTTRGGLEVALMVPTTSGVLQVMEDGSVTTYDMDGFSRTGATYWTGWIMPGGDDQADCTVRTLEIQAFSRGEHGLTIQSAYDYEGSSLEALPHQVVYTAAYITSLADPTYQHRYTLRYQLPRQNARAVRFVITETEVPPGGADAGFCPISVTLTSGIDTGNKRRVVAQGALK